MKCKHCGEETDNDSVFCENCGAKVADESPVVKKRKRNPNTKKYIGYALGVMVGIIVGVVAAVIGTNRSDGRSGSEGISEPVVDTIVAPVEKSDSERERLKVQGWVDLGLPSGTLWKNENEEGEYTYFEAREKYNDSLPSEKQIKELINKCQWKWKNDAYEIIGPNGNSIVLPALFVQINKRDGYDVESISEYKCKFDHNTCYYGQYWTSTVEAHKQTLYVLVLCFNPNEHDFCLNDPRLKSCVRLVQ